MDWKLAPEKNQIFSKKLILTYRLLELIHSRQFNIYGLSIFCYYADNCVILDYN